MRAGRRLLRLVVLLGAFGAMSAAALAASGAVSWGSAIEVPGTDTLNVKGGLVTTVSCPKPSFCTAGGEYTEASGGLDGSGAEQAFVVDEKNGVWGTAIEVPGSGALNVAGDARLFEVSCAKPGFCAAAGFYRDGDLDGHGFIANEKNGVWGSAKTVRGVPAVSGGFSVVSSISCPEAGWCSAAGDYAGPSAVSQAFVVNETNGRWGKAVKVASDAELNTISCAVPGFCSAGGNYDNTKYAGQAMVVSEMKGYWGWAQPVRGPNGFNRGQYAAVNSISCTEVIFCVAGGYYSDGHDHEHPFVVNGELGRWLPAYPVPNRAGEVDSVSCGAALTCAAGGFSTDSAQREHPFLMSDSTGPWLQVKVAGNLGTFGKVDSVSCPKAGFCAAGGQYVDGSSAGQAFVAAQRNGKWKDAIEVPGTAALNTGGDGEVWSVFCFASGSCTAGGDYRDGSRVLQAFVTSP